MQSAWRIALKFQFPCLPTGKTETNSNIQYFCSQWGYNNFYPEVVHNRYRAWDLVLLICLCILLDVFYAIATLFQ
jgi:hypothetical protein